MLQVVEVPKFIRVAEQVFTDEELDSLRVYLAYNPDAGVVIKGTGGIRKLRWNASNRGKRGGARVIYFYHNTKLPLYLLAAYTKNVKSDLTSQEKDRLQQLVKSLKGD